MAKNEIAKAEVTALAIPDAELAGMFGGPEAAMPIEVAWPEIKMTKTSDFKMPDGSKTQELVGHIVFIRTSRAFWQDAYTGADNPPDCASDNCARPNPDIENPQHGMCGKNICPRATWHKVTDAAGNETNKVECKESMNMIFLQEGRTMPKFMRIRSYSMNPKSPIAAFLIECLEPSYALGGKFQTVKVRMTLEEIKVNGFDTSMLQVSKIDTLVNGDPLLVEIGKLYNKAVKEFVVVHTMEDQVAPGGDAEPEYGDDIPI